MNRGPDGVLREVPSRVVVLVWGYGDGVLTGLMCIFVLKRFRRSLLK